MLLRKYSRKIRKKNSRSKLFLFLGIFLGTNSLAHAEKTPRVVSLSEVLEFARNKGADFRAIELDLAALSLEIRARDRVLSPTLTSSLNRTWDRRESLTSAAATRQRSTLATIEVAKPFATGTTLGALAGYEWALSPRTTPNQNLVFDWQVYASQSLWRDAFGESTRARRLADSWEERERRYVNLQQSLNYLVAIETAYWDWVFVEKEKAVRRANLERSQRIANWVERRLKLAAAEPTDLLQARSLVESRKLQIETVESKIRSVAARFESNLPGLDLSQFAPNFSEFSSARNVDTLIIEEDRAVEVASLSSVIQNARAMRLLNRAKQAKSDAQPSLVLSLKHGRNGIDGRESAARAEAFGSKNKFSEVELSLTTDLDFSTMRAAARAANLQAEAEEIRASRAENESVVDWRELQREAKALKNQLETAQRLAKLQEQKADAERLRLERGRSTAFQAITFEQEAAEAQLKVWEFELALRKLETKARLYGRFGRRE